MNGYEYLRLYGLFCLLLFSDTIDKLSQLQSKLAALETVASFQTGSTYIRWGKTSCQENGTELVYDGFVGGSDNGYV